MEIHNLHRQVKSILCEVKELSSTSISKEQKDIIINKLYELYEYLQAQEEIEFTKKIKG